MDRAGLAVALPMLLIACGPLQVRQEIDYTRLGNVHRLILADPHTVDAACYDKDGREDLGGSSRFRERDVPVYGRTGQVVTTYRLHSDVDACFERSTGTIWLSTLAPVKIFVHELCHAGTDLSDKECAVKFPGH